MLICYWMILKSKSKSVFISDMVNDTLINLIDGTQPTTSIPIIPTEHPGN